MTTGTIDVTIGLDVGKTNHHACAMLETGEIIYDKPLPQDEDQLRKVF
ncbi:MAG TPA: transposase, partial [Corynebacterium sp.]|nr:transposase [Corynebacterium sp.]